MFLYQSGRDKAKVMSVKVRRRLLRLQLQLEVKLDPKIPSS
jgi:hypothetical protein